MNILLVAEKPALAQSIAAHARDHWPGAHIAIVNLIPFANISFAPPKGLAMSDYPRMSPPRYRLSSEERWRGAPIVVASDGSTWSIPMRMSLFHEADMIVCACDPDHTGVGAFEVAMFEIFHDERALDCPALAMSALDEKSVRQAFLGLAPLRELLGESLSFGRVKRYFDWNWAVHSGAALEAALRRAGVAPRSLIMSKNSLQLLYALRGKEPMAHGAMPAMSEGAIHSMMARWKGSGAKHSMPMGSCSSRHDILSQLKDAGLLDTELSHGRQAWRVSMRGEDFIQGLHAGCEDVDLPFRLYSWCEQGLPAAQPEIDRYLTRLFGDQLRFAKQGGPA